MKRPEIWKKVDFADGYEVSNDGQVKSFKRNGIRILKPGLSAYGYKFVVLMINQKMVSKSVHRLVAHAFLGPSSLTVNHKNGIKTDNRIENLEYMTARENIIHGRKLPINRIGLKMPFGVMKNINGYYAHVTIDKTRHYLGLFRTAQAAGKCRERYDTITELTKEIENLETKIATDTAMLKELRKAYKSFYNIWEAAKAIKVPVTTEKESMKTEEIKSIKIELEGDESEKFKSAIKKVDIENGKAGFHSSMDADEIKLIRDLNKKLNP